MRSSSARRAVAAVAGVLVLLVLAAPVPGALPVAAAAAPVPTNVLLINVDDQDWSSVPGFSPYPQGDLMPRTRRWLARGGVTYRFGSVTDPTCCPSRATDLTGQYPHNHGVRTIPQYGALDHARTVQATLQRAGYATAMAGKLFHRWPLSQDPPYWDEWLVVEPDAYVDPSVNWNGRTGGADALFGRGSYSTDLVGDHIVRSITRFAQEGRPWFAYMAPIAPHGPAEPSPRYASAPVPAWQAPREADRSDKPPWVRRRTPVSDDAMAQLYRARTRTLMSVDEQVDRVMRLLSSTGQLSRTLVVYHSDNGYLLGEHGLDRKFLPYAPSLRVPFYARLDGRLPAGAVDRRLASNVDIAATIYDATGTPPGLRQDGRSLLAPGSRDVAYAEHTSDPTANGSIPSWRTVWNARSKYTVYYDAGGAVVWREFYDEARDPHELTDLLHDGVTANDPDLRSWDARIARARACAGADCP